MASITSSLNQSTPCIRHSKLSCPILCTDHQTPFSRPSSSPGHHWQILYRLHPTIKMSGYSKIKIFGAANSRSMDLSDLSLAFPEPTKSNTSTSLEHQESETKIINQDIDTMNVIRSGTTSATTQDSLSVLEDDQENDVEERFSMKLRRNPSVSSSASAVKKAFSMRRSTSVSEGYCRIHNQSMPSASPIHDEDDTLDTMKSTRSAKKKHSRGRILGACKKLFGL
ncbi:hypothetical protein NC652_012186 [Populus alba x Populus x berolinensis]|uniref:Uncharacterized protein n=1 Tax=Populus tomentosa TaxID=118781 RepID=A0A8X8A902_POPTO|nr:hypothetical protein POTOM_016425 [Populus tomentosa]KAJ6937809.1 hypothetical protein NC652_012186 [Populus alba x Populus x berolinensis]